MMYGAGKEKERKKGKQLYISLILLLLALVSITAATTAWFTIADHTKVQSMGLEIFSGGSLRFDLVPHETLEEYTKTLTFEEICRFALQEQGTDLEEYVLEPVTTQDCSEFVLENDTVVESDSGKYLEFTLHFMAGEDMIVHLTSANSEGKEDGTLVSSQPEEMVQTLRISFTAADRINIYSPGGIRTEAPQGTGIFTLPSADEMVYNDSNALFSLNAYEDFPVVVHIWMEGTDEACTDELRGAEYSVRMRFEGTDEENRPIDGTSRRQTEEVPETE